MKASKNPRSEWKEGHDATDSKASDSPFPRGVMRPITSGRSPGSWFPRVFEPSSPPSNLPQAQRNLSGSNERRLPTYSGGTAPASHRLPFYAPMGTQSDQKYSALNYAGRNCLSRKIRSTLFCSTVRTERSQGRRGPFNIPFLNFKNTPYAAFSLVESMHCLARSCDTLGLLAQRIS